MTPPLQPLAADTSAAADLAPPRAEVAPLGARARALPDPSRERRARRVWVGLVCALLIGSVVTQFTFLAIASSDPSVVAEPDYYRKAVDWNAERAQRADNARLGWRLGAELAPASGGRRQVRVRALDAQGAPLADLSLSLRAFHKTQRASVLRAQLTRRGEGLYVADLPDHGRGRWELRFEARRKAPTSGEEERFTSRQNVEAP